ncbi:glycosyltransferase [Sphaerotilus sp.]|jgi:glycosyltransferase involved in cell wall biosynthesis|uniref:glycosyltransferase n=1 Tax=Sphaerotilus sp. TaxID=2093942 RepID=UPI0025F48A73|nr:glycosyltransferase [Sphaerotilus sp.]
MSLRLMHIVDSLEFGGLERVVTDLAIEQKRRGDTVCVFSLLHTQGLKSELEAAGIEVIVGGKRDGVDLPLIGRLRRAITERRIALVHAHNFVPNYHAAAALWGRWQAPKLVCSLHDMGFRLDREARLRRFFQWSIGRTAGFAMVGSQVHGRYVGSGMVAADKATTVLNGIPVDRFRWTPERRWIARERLGVPQDALLIGAVGRQVALKNHALLIALMPALLQRHPSLRLALVGSGPLEAELRAQAEAAGLGDRVILTGQRRDVSDLTPGFDIFAMPSLTEGLSIALLEACATRLAIVATAVGGNPEIVREGETGLLVPPGEGPPLLQALDTLLADAPLRERLGQAACDWVREHGSIGTLFTAFQQFYARH